MQLKTSKVILAVVITVVVVGGGVYFWEILNDTELRSSPSVPTQEKKGETLLYQSEDLDYSLVIPTAWKKYNYKVTYHYTSKSDASNVDDVEKYEDIYTADFSDWSNFELLRIGRMPAIIWYAELKNYTEVMKVDPNWDKPAFLQNKIGETGVGPNAQVYYSINVRQDAPQLFVDDKEPMPDLSIDFKISSN